MDDNLIFMLIGAAVAAFGAWSIYRKEMSLQLQDRDEMRQRNNESMSEFRARRRNNKFRLAGNAAVVGGAGVTAAGLGVVLGTLTSSVVLIILGIVFGIILTVVGVGMQLMTIAGGIKDDISRGFADMQDAAEQIQSQVEANQQAGDNNERDTSR